MNSFYSKEELKNFNFKSIGNDVLISRKCSIYNPELMSIGSQVRIDDFCILSGRITIGSHVHIAAYTALYGKAGIELEDFTGISPRCSLFSTSDDFNGDYLISPTTLPEHNHIIKGKIKLEKYSQLGASCVVLPAVTVKEGTAVGSMSLLIKSTLSWSIYTGIPAVKIKDRKKGLIELAKQYS